MEDQASDVVFLKLHSNETPLFGYALVPDDRRKLPDMLQEGRTWISGGRQNHRRSPASPKAPIDEIPAG